MLPLLLVLTASVAFFVGMRVQERRLRGKSSRFANPPRDTPESPRINFEALIEGLRQQAFAYAIYVELMHSRVRPEQKKQLYKTYGHVNLPPKLEDDALFTSHPELMSSQEFLEKLNKWIVRNGGAVQPTFFAASETMGRLLVDSQMGHAKTIVSEVSAG